MLGGTGGTRGGSGIAGRYLRYRRGGRRVTASGDRHGRGRMVSRARAPRRVLRRRGRGAGVVLVIRRRRSALSAAKEYFSERQYGRASPRVVAAGQPVPKGGGRYIVGEPYRVAGKTYIPRDNPRLFGDRPRLLVRRRLPRPPDRQRRGLRRQRPDGGASDAAAAELCARHQPRQRPLGDRARQRPRSRSPATASSTFRRRSPTCSISSAPAPRGCKVDYIGPAQMDGLDQRMLMASVSRGRLDLPQPAAGGGIVHGGAGAGAAHPARSVERLPGAGRRRRSDAARAAGRAGDLDLDDPLAPLILRTSFAAPTPRPTVTAPAAAALRPVRPPAALERAAAKATRLRRTAGGRPGRLVRRPANAARVAAASAGSAADARARSGGRILTVVGVVDPALTPTRCRRRG